MRPYLYGRRSRPVVVGLTRLFWPYGSVHRNVSTLLYRPLTLRRGSLERVTMKIPVATTPAGLTRGASSAST